MRFADAVDTDAKEVQAAVAVPRYFAAYEKAFELPVYRPVKVTVVCDRGDRLIVESDRDLASLLRDTLGEGRRYQVATAGCAFEAGALAQELQPHVLVLDMDVTGMDPRAVSRFLAGRVELQRIRLIATGASLSEPERSALLQEGFSGVLAKPYHIRELSHVIDRAVHPTA